MTDLSLEEIRRTIDSSDREIVQALGRRLAAVHQVAEVKTAKGLPVYDGVREKALLQKLRVLAGEGLEGGAVPVYRTLMAFSRRCEVTPDEPDDQVPGTFRLSLPSEALFAEVMAMLTVHAITPAAMSWIPPLLLLTLQDPVPGSLVRDLREHDITLTRIQ
ncbi:MAG: chorismate mutase [Sutterella sp.]|nr:chorismate mutase [Sutterella sp.]